MNVHFIKAASFFNGSVVFNTSEMNLSAISNLTNPSTVIFVCLWRLLVEKIFAQFMVPHSLETEEKMKCLYYLYACLDTNAVK